MHPNFIILVVITCYILGVIGIVITNYVVCELGLLALICNVLLEGTDGTRNKYLDSLIASIIKVVPKWCPVCSLEIIICTLFPTKCFIKIKQVRIIGALSVAQTTPLAQIFCQYLLESLYFIFLWIELIMKIRAVLNPCLNYVYNLIADGM